MTIKILHLADVHIGMENYGRINSKTGLHTRFEDFLTTFDQVVGVAKEEAVDLVIFAGDAFKNRDPNPTQQREFAKRIMQLSKLAPLVMLVGNHDLPNTDGKAHSMEIYGTLETPGVFIARKPELMQISTRNGPVQIAALPYISRSSILTQKEYKNLTIEEIHRKLVEKVGSDLNEMINQSKRGIPIVLCGHLSVAGALVGSERAITLGGEMIIPLDVLARRELTYGALGHIHKYQVVCSEPLLVYSGSMDRIDFGEEKDSKGVVIAEINGLQASHRFIPLPVRPFITLRVNLEEEMDPQTKILQVIEEADLDQAVVKLIISMEQENYIQINLNTIRKALDAKAFYCAGIVKEWTKTVNITRNPELTEKIDPLEALAKYLNQKAIKPQEVNEVISRAQVLAQEIREEEAGMVR